ncbi:MAG: hypothetical protein JWQ89_4206 [Devosia sp.]|uniref:hypothetical protein n=1 Tax=Devosia sp. TaxID=1871048 RepID=UPI002612B664|nr:hypothetical protein [Devosia sp.]MDB5542479.1 hypothetical protein [Devosia sp.]
MQVRIAVAALAGLMIISAAPAALAQTPADFTKFNESCLAAAPFLLGQVPDGVDTASILSPLCGCLATSFKDLPQTDVDVLAADLRGEGTDAVHTAHGSYDKVAETARQGLTTCFASPEVVAAMEKAAPPATAPAPAQPAPVSPPPTEPAPPATPPATQ